MTITTPRLKLICGSLEFLQLEWSDPARFAERIGYRLAPDWPPGLYDEDARGYFEAKYHGDAKSANWLIWYVAEPICGSLIGVFGFLAAPDEDGEVVMGYSISEGSRRQGYATEAVGALTHWAFEQEGVTRIVADTEPDLIASIGVLRKNGFNEIGPGPETGTIRFRLDRANS